MSKKRKSNIVALLLCGVMLCMAGCGSAETSSLLDSSSIEVNTSDVATSESTGNQEYFSSNETVVSKDSETSMEKIPTTSKDETSSDTKPSVQLIVTCYGDSVTEGMDVDADKNYPSILGNLLGSGYKVQNAGDGGEKTTAIMARQGALKIYTKSEIKFEAGQTSVLIDSGVGRGFVAEDGREPSWNEPYGRDLPIKNLKIDGKIYTLQFKNFKWNSQGGGNKCDTYLVRSDASAEETIPANSQAVLDITTTSKNNYCDIYFMGFNKGYDSIDELISQYQKMIAYRNDDNYLIVIPFWEKVANKTAYEKFKSAFGDHAIDLVEYCKNGGIEKAGLSLQSYDNGCLENEVLPYSLKLYTIKNRADVHLNASGYKVLANAVYEQGQKIGLWK